MLVKKQFEEIATLLEANKNRKVSSILPELLELMSRKNNASGQANTFVKDDEGNVVAIYCYYHKKWEVVSECEYGKKANTATGLNTMCKEGVSNWTKQQRIKKANESKLLDELGKGTIDVSEIGAKQAEIREESTKIVEREDAHGFESSDEALDSIIVGE